MDYKIQKSTAMVYKIRLPNGGWADITIEEWEKGGSFKCVSDYGNYSYIWTSIGEQTLRGFLCQLDFYYFMMKAHKSKSGMQFSLEKTIELIKRDIIQQRRGDDLNSTDARTCWEEAEQLDTGNSIDLFYNLFSETKAAKLIYAGDPCVFPAAEEVIPQCEGFWELIWPCICEVWRDELKAKAA